MERREERRDPAENAEKKDDRSIHHRREGVSKEEAETPTRSEPLSEADRDRSAEAPVPASKPRD